MAVRVSRRDSSLCVVTLLVAEPARRRSSAASAPSWLRVIRSFIGSRGAGVLDLVQTYGHQ